MIREDLKLLKTHFTVLPDAKTDVKLILNLVEKIKNKQREPFAKIYLTLHPLFFVPLMAALEKEKIVVKNIGTDKTVFYIEL